ncbi:MAG: serine/threonine protein kinase [Cyanobacteria bacterium HKST-UBA02]|nr:serine/threonine protein kinase [Cyanobacteria bacterium HKST-UBA02]
MTTAISRQRKCPACNRVYQAPLVVCPKDRTMLLSRMEPASDFDCWLEDAGMFTWRICEQCKRCFDEEKYGVCPEDGTWLTPYPVTVREGPLLEERFRLLGFLGKNHLFAVYLARDIETSTPVVVKIMARAHYQDERTLTRILKIARQSLSLRHPAIVTRHSVNLSGVGHLYFVEEYLECRSLEHELRHKRYLEIPSFLSMFKEVARGLEHAHANQAFHGALTCANLYLLGDKMKIGNFGVAERLFRNLEWNEPSSETRTANVYGEVESMCPEFARGQRPDALTDIYQLGCTMYQTLTGQLPFTRSTAIATIMAHMEDSPDPMRCPQVVPETLEEIVLSCLEKDREKRCQTASELLSKISGLS